MDNNPEQYLGPVMEYADITEEWEDIQYAEIDKLEELLAGYPTDQWYVNGEVWPHRGRYMELWIGMLTRDFIQIILRSLDQSETSAVIPAIFREKLMVRDDSFAGTVIIEIGCITVLEQFKGDWQAIFGTGHVII